MLRRILLEYLSVNCGDVLASCGQLVLGPHPVIDRDDLDLLDGRDRNGLDQRRCPGARYKAVAMDIQENSIAVSSSNAVLRCDDVRINPGDRLVLYIHGVSLANRLQEPIHDL